MHFLDLRYKICLIFFGFTAGVSAVATPSENKVPLATSKMRIHNSALAFDAYWKQARNKAPTDQMRLFRRLVYSRFPQFYEFKFRQWMAAGKNPELEISEQTHRYDAYRQKFLTVTNELPKQLLQAQSTFRKFFPDFNPEFDVYLTHSLDEMDGGTRLIDGKFYFIFGAESIAQYHRSLELAAKLPFLHHELFHLYHRGFFQESESLFSALWAEGLAELVARRLNPNATEAQLGLDNPAGLIEKSHAVWENLLTQTENKLESSDKDDYATFFYGSSKHPWIPRRAGYYVGYRIAEKASKKYSLIELAKLEPSKALVVIRNALTELKQELPEITHRDRSGGNTVSVLGSIHGHMLSNPGYRLRDFVLALESYKPDVILTEVRRENPGPLEGSIDGGIEQSIVYAYAATRNISVIPSDWFDDEFINEMTKDNAVTVPNADALYEKYSTAIRNEPLLSLNSSETQAILRRIYTLIDDQGLKSARRRNERICENILNSLKALKDKRVLVVFGLDHKFFLDDCVKRTANEVKDVADWFKTSSQVIPTDIATKALENMVASKKLLSEQLAKNVYKGSLRERLTNKLGDFDRWIEAMTNEIAASANTQSRKLAEEVLERVVAESEKFWGRKLGKPIKLNFKVGRDRKEWQWPTSWGLGPEAFGLGLHESFDLPETWWNMEDGQAALLAKATLRQKYILAVSHEVTHIFMYPSPIRPWFQEAVAMKVGREIARRIDPSVAELYPAKAAVISLKDVEGFSYDGISHSLDECRQLQAKSYFLVSKIDLSELASWVIRLRIENRDPLTDKRSAVEVDKEILSAAPKSFGRH